MVKEVNYMKCTPYLHNLELCDSRDETAKDLNTVNIFWYMVQN